MPGQNPRPISKLGDNEGVRISHLDPETRMNSKDEFLQGTNLFLVPVRGVGM